MEIFAAEVVDLLPLAKGIALGFGVLGPALAIGMIGTAFMNGVSRNPESAKFFGQILVFVSLAELFGLIAFASIFIIK
jgi:F0F1-type ATP synthase membrane subunit c/vacuolar-type H+-ATPase subunit K